MNEAFSYDAVDYDSEANPDAHPRAMASIARALGFPAAPPDDARVLEIGCGNGENLLAAATYLPAASFEGFDLAGRAIEDGTRQAEASGLSNVTLRKADIREERAAGLGGYDYVVAHGLLSWVPGPVKDDLLALMRDALAPNGVGFVSFNALPGWELRRALRQLALRRADLEEAPDAKVRVALARIGDVAGAAGYNAFGDVLAAAARGYLAHVDAATPPDAPFSRYVFHDLLATPNDPFDLDGARALLAARGLTILAETPLRPSRAAGEDLARDMAFAGTPFLQLLVRRDDAPSSAAAMVPDAVADMFLWADFRAGASGAVTTSTGATFRPAKGSAVERAAARAPGFVQIRDIAGDALAAVTADLFGAWCNDVLSLHVTAPPTVDHVNERPRVAGHVRARAAAAVARGAATTSLTSAIHRSYHVPLPELLVVRELDGTQDVPSILAKVRASLASAPPGSVPDLLRSSDHAAAELVNATLDRMARHVFLLP